MRLSATDEDLTDRAGVLDDTTEAIDGRHVQAPTETPTWLVVSYFANIQGACQSEWVEDRISALGAYDLRIKLISSVCGPRHREFFHRRAVSLSPSDLTYELGFVLKRHETGWLSWAIKRLLLPFLYPLSFVENKLLKMYGEGRWSWMPFAVVSGLLLCWKKRPAVIYSTGGPASAHMVAAAVSAVTGSPWIAEFQDPLVGKDIGRNWLSRKGLKYIEKRVFNRARKVVFCTKAARDSAVERYGSGKAECIYPGSSVKTIGIRDNNRTRCRFIYLGSLYQSRNLDRFIEALLLVLKARPEFVDRISLDLYGNIDRDIADRIRRHQLPFLHMNGVVTREEAVACASESDVLLLIQNTDDRSSLTIPFKTYDYLRLGRTILGLTYRNLELQELLLRHNHIAVSADDSLMIKCAIDQILDLWSLGKLGEGIVGSELTSDRAAAHMLDIAKAL